MQFSARFLTAVPAHAVRSTGDRKPATNVVQASRL